ncbi:uncharacterized protein LOC106163389 isoform X3 [Lingula anatina]|uniref:Uncharacterized protein LOC106163389 isoform X3 n=1 Tax=Lingula anatina TaxID=7574 RepID=A0A1S3IE23_LINAN|nr:uncharacterized protein LOC106163389 isoform X3 [Lingula anatina]|eukprot:XP_013396408.1 uncharacterized protein LOC106163389 isoform X3 [Lingula anatina]
MDGGGGDILNCSEDQFDLLVRQLDMQDRMSCITTLSLLQKEMAREQEHFNQLTAQLAQAPDNSAEQDKISEQLVQSQNRLQMLMGRNMKCFSQQSFHPSVQIQDVPNTETDTKKKPPKPARATNGSVHVDQGVRKDHSTVVTSAPKLTVKPLEIETENSIPVEIRNFHSADVVIIDQNDSSNGKKNDEKRESDFEESDEDEEEQKFFITVPDDIKTDIKLSVKPEPYSQTKEDDLVEKTVAPTVQAVPDGKDFKRESSVDRKAKADTIAQAAFSNLKAQKRKSQSEDESLPDAEVSKNIPVKNVIIIEKTDKVGDMKPPSEPSKPSHSSENTQNKGSDERHKVAAEITLGEEKSKVNDQSEALVNGSAEPLPEVEEMSVNHLKEETIEAVSQPPPKKSGGVKVISGKKAEEERATKKTAVKQEESKNSVFEKEIVEKKESPVSASKSASTWFNSGGEVDGEVDQEEEIVQPRVTLKNWDPVKLMKEIYRIKLEPQEDEDLATKFITMEGYMEKLPMGKKKATLLKTWKKRYFRAKEGNLFYYDSQRQDRPSGFVQLMGGTVDEIGGKVLGIDDGRGHYLMVRCPTDREYNDWKVALESQTVDHSEATYVRPVLKPTPHKTRKVIVLDLGSCSVRAGLLGKEPSLPQVFFPCVVAVNKTTGQKFYGFDAYKPDVRDRSTLVHPIKPSIKVDKFTLDLELLPGVLEKVFQELQINPAEHWVMMSIPQNSNKLKEDLMTLLIDQYSVIGVSMVAQPILALYSYSNSSGVIVDIGERMDIVPIIDGYIVDAGLTRQAYGGQRVADDLNHKLTENRYHFSTEVEKWIVRYVLEQICYVATDYNQELVECSKNPAEFRKALNLTNFDVPQGTCEKVDLEAGRFISPEGLMNTELWGMDNPTVPKLVHKAVQACPMDHRREMYRHIYLSGGVTMLPGFAERLQIELSKLVPSSIVVQVHASPQRYHAAYIGASTLGNLGVFEQTCITRQEWKSQGTQAFKKWT